MDHGGGAGREGFVVAGQAAVEHEPAQGAFDDAASWQWGEATAAGWALDDLHVDADRGGVLDEVLAVAAVHPELADSGMGDGELVDQRGAGDRVLDGGGGDQDGLQQPEGVDHDAAFTADDLLGGVDALVGGRNVA